MPVFRQISLAFVIAAVVSCGSPKSAPVAAADPYIDARTCRACHAAIFDSYQHVGMARSFAPASKVIPVVQGRSEHAPSRRRYEVVERDGHIFQRRVETGLDGIERNAYELEATHAIGSGNHARTFLHRSPAGEFIELPLTWYSQEKQWALSPGFEGSTPPDFTRIVDDRCLFCHNGYPSKDGVLASGIDCQRCHGPGARHVELASAGRPKAEVAAAVVNPSRLDAERQLDVCMQCHLETTSSELPAMIRRFGRGVNSFRPGEHLADYVVQFDDDRREKFEVVNQAYRMRQSACFLRSNGRLTCTTCHNPHDVPRGEAATARHREQCRSCHTTVAAARHPDLRTADCIACHMPRRRTEDAVHVVMTDHKIQRRPSPPQQSGKKDAGQARLFYPAALPAAEAELYLGVALIVGKSGTRAGIERIESLPANALPPGALAVLAEGYFAEGRNDKAIETFKSALAKDPSLSRAGYNLAQAYEAAGRAADARIAYESVMTPFPELDYARANFLRKSGDLNGAKMFYEKAIGARPTYAEAYGNLGSLFADQGRPAEARAALEQAIRINPAFGDAHNNLGRVLATQGAVAEALPHLRRAVSLNANDARARYNLARVLQEANSMDEAIAEYRQALKIEPGLAEAHLGLGQALGDLGRIDAAIAEFREVLRLRPNDAEALRNLNMALAAKRGGAR